MKRRIRIRVMISVVAIIVIMAAGLSGLLLYNNVYVGSALIDRTSLSDAELEKFYNELEGSTDEQTEKASSSSQIYSGRTLTSEVVPYDGVTRSIVCWGDSMTEGVGFSYAVIEKDDDSLDISYWTYPDALEYFTGLDTLNFGVSGENSEEIAVRAGGIKLYTDRDIVVGYRHGASVRVVNSDGGEEYVQNYGGYGGVYGNFNYGRVYINGQEYTLNGAVYDDEEQAYELTDLYMIRFTQDSDSFTTQTVNPSVTAASDAGQTTDGVTGDGNVPSAGSVNANKSATAEDVSNGANFASTPITAEEAMEMYNVGYLEEFSYEGDTCIIIPAGTLVTPKAAADYSNSILVIEIGSNGGWQNDYATLIKQIDSIIERFNNPYYIVVGDTDDPGDSADANQGMLDQNGNSIGRSDTYWEAALREAYGAHFLNTREYIITNGLSDVGMITTKRDLRYFQSGMISKKLRADWTHFNSYGYYTQAKAIYLKGVELGYWD